MLQELAARTNSVAWTIGSMLFFLVVWVGVAVFVIRSRKADMDARARLPFEDGAADSGIRSQESDGRKP